jgi:transcriptional regulator with XRE-family HTH domain
MTFGQKIALLRKAKKLSQSALAKEVGTSFSVISRYERDEMLPSVENAKKIAIVLGTTVGYLLGEVDNNELLKDQTMLKRFQELMSLSPDAREHILYALDVMIGGAKARQSY